MCVLGVGVGCCRGKPGEQSGESNLSQQMANRGGGVWGDKSMGGGGLGLVIIKAENKRGMTSSAAAKLSRLRHPFTR